MTDNEVLTVMIANMSVHNSYPSMRQMEAEYGMDGMRYLNAVYRLIARGDIIKEVWKESVNRHKRNNKTDRKYPTIRKKRTSLGIMYTPRGERKGKLVEFINKYREANNGHFPTNREASVAVKVPNCWMAFAMKELIRDGVYTLNEYRDNQYRRGAIREKPSIPREVFIPQYMLPKEQFDDEPMFTSKKEPIVEKLHGDNMPERKGNWMSMALDVITWMKKNPELKAYIKDYLS